MSTTPSPFQDHAGPILAADPTLSDESRASLWDIFHQSKDANELASKLQPIPVADDLKHRLWTAKQAVAPIVAPEPVDKVTAAVTKMVSLPDDVLAKAEAHPALLKVFAEAAKTPATEAPGAVGATSASGKDKKTPEAAKPLAAPLAPRADGQPHFPAIPEDHHRVLAGNGGVYDVPKDRLEDARKIDPALHVLNPDS